MPYTPFVAPGGQDLTPNSYSDVGGGKLNQQIVSQYDLYKPNEMVQVFERHTGYTSFRLMIRAMGFTRGTAAPTTGHYEYPWRDNLITVGAKAGGAVAGAALTITLDAGDMFNAGATVGGAARQASYPRPGMMLQLPDGTLAKIQSKNTAVTPHEIVIAPMDATVVLDSVVNVNDAYFAATVSHTEGSGLPEGHTPRIIEYTNTFQILKEAVYSTGSELTNEMYFDPAPDQSGSLFLKADRDAMYRFEEYYDGALIWGQQNNNPGVLFETPPELGFDVPDTGTEGMIPFALTNGFEDNYTVGSYNINELDEISRYYEGERIGVRDIMALQGIDINIEIENTIQALLNADLTAQLSKEWLGGGAYGFTGDTSYMDPSDFALKIGFRGVKKSNYNYMFYMMHPFNKNTGAGSASYNYKNWQVMFPIGYATSKDSGERRPTVGYEYKMLNGLSRENIVGSFAGAGANYYSPAVNGTDLMTMFYVAEVAGHFTCGNHMVIQKPV